MLSRKGVDLKTEAIAGLTTFFTMAYIVVVNPSILATPGTGMPFNGVLTATVLVCFFGTLLMGLYANLPFAVAPGMGINAFFTFSLVLGKQIPWPTALGMMFWSGVITLVISATPLRIWIAQAIPPSLRVGVAAGIGIFLTFIGLKNSGIIVADTATLVKVGTLGPASALSIVGIFLSAFLLQRKSPFAFLAPILLLTLLGVTVGLVPTPKALVAAPDFESVFFKLDIWSALAPALWPAILSLMFTDLFDSLSTFVGVAHATNFIDKKGEMPRMKEGLIVDSISSFSAGLFGSSSGTTYIESASGIEVGGRTGWTSVFTALCFLPCFFLAPLAGSVPAFATTPVLVLVGALMFRSLTELDFHRLEDMVPAYLTMVFIPLTFSITQGILWGFVSHVLLYALCGRAREVKPALYLIAVLSVFLIALDH